MDRGEGQVVSLPPWRRRLNNRAFTRQLRQMFLEQKFRDIVHDQGGLDVRVVSALAQKEPPKQ